jgi:hypothetical protein
MREVGGCLGSSGKTSRIEQSPSNVGQKKGKPGCPACLYSSVCPRIYPPANLRLSDDAWWRFLPKLTAMTRFCAALLILNAPVM